MNIFILLPVNSGGHSAYQNFVVTNLHKYYPNPDKIARSTWDIIDRFWNTLQQLMNLTNMLILGKDYELANQALSLYESLVLKHEGNNSFDYAVCQMGKGIIALAQNDPQNAELFLLEAEQKITTVMGVDSDYSKTCYRYLYNLYSRWHKREKALSIEKSYFLGNLKISAKHIFYDKLYEIKSKWPNSTNQEFQPLL